MKRPDSMLSATDLPAISDPLIMQQMMEQVPLAMYYADMNYRYLYANRAYRMLVDPSHEQVVGKTVPEVIGKSFPALKNQIDRALKGETVYFEVDNVIVKGDCMAATYVPAYEHGSLAGYFGFIENVTEKKNAQRLIEQQLNKSSKALSEKDIALQKSEERYHKMIDEVEDYAILLLDRNGIIQNWNRGAQKIKGYTTEEIVGKHFSIFYLPEDRANGLPARILGEAAGKGKAVMEGWRRRKDGSRFWGSMVLTALHDDDNNIIGFTKVTRDLTEKKISEDTIRQYAANLEAQNKELEQFAFIASHDMKEPLRKISFYSNYLSEALGDRITEKEREYLEKSIHAARRMQILIEDILSYSKTASLEKEMETIDLNKVIKAVLSNNEDGIAESKAIISVQELPAITGIYYQLVQLFDNLINNSIKYRSTERQLEIAITVQTVDSGPGEKCIRITVADNGIGFEQEHANKIFSLFQRLVNKNKYPGSGIGLAICQKIMQHHKGTIEAYGQEGAGARFVMSFPVSSPV